MAKGSSTNDTWAKEFLDKLEGHMDLLRNSVRAQDDALICVGLLRMAYAIFTTLTAPRLEKYLIASYKSPSGGGNIDEMIDWVRNCVKG